MQDDKSNMKIRKTRLNFEHSVQCAAVEAAPSCNKSSLKKKALSDPKKHTFSEPLTQLTVEGQKHDIRFVNLTGFSRKPRKFDEISQLF